uniref:Signal recognition particle 14 kDa protein n=1 Tax=Octactis speculum TaxID=3111310 RepID=A0A7S2G1U2_9STRA|mmetsp:Transcript_36043/g.48756  ORF Transcript_36043/g.48756 Transcript_36043/m.48756 type:complete len:102 (+) Transcript_36043:57-362(+)
MVVVDQDTFLTQLTKMYEESRDQGTVSITLKRVSVKGTPEDPNRCMVRARCSSKKTQISTMVAARDSRRFQEMMSNIMKVHMDSLKRKQRKKNNRGSMQNI